MNFFRVNKNLMCLSIIRKKKVDIVIQKSVDINKNFSRGLLEHPVYMSELQLFGTIEISLYFMNIFFLVDGF